MPVYIPVSSRRKTKMKYEIPLSQKTANFPSHRFRVISFIGRNNHCGLLVPDLNDLESRIHPNSIVFLMDLKYTTESASAQMAGNSKE